MNMISRDLLSQHKAAGLIVIMAAAALTSTVCVAAGFDCSKAIGIEKSICADHRLSRLDDELNIAYKLNLAQGNHRAEQVAEQRRWISDKRNACADNACLARAYRQRINTIQSEILVKPNLCGLEETSIKGVWRGLNESQFEELEISNHDGKPMFSSWRHERPEYDGSWVFKDCKLRLVDPADANLVFDYIVFGIVDQVLYLKRLGRDESSLYRKIRN
jgi:uncharacterized protein